MNFFNIDNVKSDHLYIVWQTNDSNNTRLCYPSHSSCRHPSIPQGHLHTIQYIQPDLGLPHTQFHLLPPSHPLAVYIIIIIIKKCLQCNSERDWYTPYQSEDPSPTYQYLDRKKRKGKIVGDYSRDRAS